MTYISRAKDAIKQVARFDAVIPSNAQLVEMGQAALYQPNARPLWNKILTQNSLAINPNNLAVLDDIGTLVQDEDGETFTPSNAATKSKLIALVFLRLTRRQWRNWLQAFRLQFANAAAEPLATARATILSEAVEDGKLIIGDDDDDPES